MSGIFLSYRRDDSAGFAGRLADALESEFGSGSVFRDVDDIRPGEDFVKAIQSRLREAAAVLVMIGPRWIGQAGESSRLHEPGDFVRREIEAALATGKPVFPLLVGGAAMPGEDRLPASIAGLARKQAVALLDGNWHHDVQKLIGSLRPLLPADAQVHAGRRKLILGLAGGGAGLILLAFGLRHWLRPPPVPEAKSIDIAGRWKARVKYGWGDEYDEVFEFKNLNNRLHGSATYLTGRLIIEQAKLEGEWLSFITRSEEMLGSDNPWKVVTHRYTGRVAANEIQFTLENTGGYSVYAPMEFVARRENK
jgi:hypothetical protein